MASTSLLDLTPDTRERAEAFIAAAKAQGLDVSVASTLRSCADQGTSVVPINIQGMLIKRAPGCRSWHVFGRAFDIVLKDPSPERYQRLGELGESFGLVWGGRFSSNPDPIHFEYHPGLDIQTLCPDPTRCEEAVSQAGLPVPGPLPPPGSTSPSKPRSGLGAPIAFVAGAVVSWYLVRRGR